MNITDQNNGFTVLCDQNGLIRKLLRDSIGLAEIEPAGKMMFSFIDADSRHRFLDFLTHVKSKKVAFLYQIDIILNGNKHPFIFGGVFSDPDILIVASANKTELFELINQQQEINNELLTRIRKLEKEKHENENKRKEEDNRIYNDITSLNNELINLQRELARKNAELVNLNDLKNRFLGMAAHDLRNPIGIICSYSDFLIDEARDILSSEHNEFLDIIHSSAEFMLELIDDLLDISKIESGKIDLHKELFPIEQLMLKIVGLNKVLSQKKNIDIELIIIKQGLLVNADAPKLEQVFNNLLSNAIKFSIAGTVIKVEISGTENSVLTGVHDKGQGIPETELDKLFKPFQKTSVKSTGGERSTGLGLSIAKRIVEAHAGSIRVESKVGEGTIFYVELPLMHETEN
jgi:signal transduction histidine kinase